LPGWFGERLPLPPGLADPGQDIGGPGGCGLHISPRDSELLVPGSSFGIVGSPAFVDFAAEVLVGGAGLQADQSQVLGDIYRRPGGFLLVGTAAKAELTVAAAAQVDVIDAAECGEGGMPVGSGLRRSPTGLGADRVGRGAIPVHLSVGA
jgi:hypothetical protein